MLAALSALLVIYSQFMSFAWDEGFHVLTAQLIMRGKEPYIDWLFPQTLLNAYWNAFWMRVFGDTWRTVHAVAAVMASGALVMTADYLYTRFPVPRWRLAAALTGAFAIGLNAVVVDFGTVGQAYGFCLFMIVAAFRLSVLSVDRSSLLLAAAAGFFAGAGPAGSLLTTWVCPVLAIWLLLSNRAGNRWIKLAAFAACALIPFLPMLRLFLMNPALTKFNIIDYHLYYRQVQWEGAIHHDIGVMMAWVDSGNALLLGLLAIAGVLFVRFHSDWPKPRKSEFYLCAWLTLALGAQLLSAHPTFPRYFLLTVPFLGILAAAGLFWINSRLYNVNRPVWAVAVFALLNAVALAKYIDGDWDSFHWPDFERLAAKVDQVTPRTARFSPTNTFSSLLSGPRLPEWSWKTPTNSR